MLKEVSFTCFDPHTTNLGLSLNMYLSVDAELTNRRILEELQLKKQMLLKQGAVAPLTATTISLSQPSPVSQLPMCSIPPVSATAVSLYYDYDKFLVYLKVKFRKHLQDLELGEW